MESKFSGEGTYSYACSNPDCFFCREVLIRPFLSQVELPAELFIPMKAAHIPKPRFPGDDYFFLSPYQRRKRREHDRITPLSRWGKSFMKLDQTW